MTDGGKGQPKVTAGLDLGDKYSYLCLIDTESGEVIEEGRLRTAPETFRRRFASERPLRIAIETGTHSPWVNRVLEECAHEVLVANPRKVGLDKRSLLTEVRVICRRRGRQGASCRPVRLRARPRG